MTAKNAKVNHFQSPLTPGLAQSNRMGVQPRLFWEGTEKPALLGHLWEVSRKRKGKASTSHFTLLAGKGCVLERSTPFQLKCHSQISCLRASGAQPTPSSPSTFSRSRAGSPGSPHRNTTREAPGSCPLPAHRAAHRRALELAAEVTRGVSPGSVRGDAAGAGSPGRGKTVSP